ncbi:efflux transporter periplasmic adaptor subunit [Rhodococcus sp. SRB_17]|uniref:HlyD family secretion protein n=1 Tax=Acidovorax sp. SRB_24 TaxID=1962700 RepID=UPI00145CB28D|nr:HlyD family secretion protein [Acidovorax sp. SRB_24]NMM75908.1 efflux transporter periplasmic adaptor subunit [Acidovorax sp. SRB_24]NMM89945.1 efflux transporter periplasmic adaptor subunit [Rhodococcus sp. SRB_17]
MPENNASTAADVALKKRRNVRLAALGGVVALAAVGSAAYWKLHASHFVSTDNAYAAAEVAQITPSVAGIVQAVNVSDTQAVRQGDVLLVIDPTDAQLALAQATAELDRATRRVKSYMANDTNLAAQISAREADAQRASAQLAAAQADFERAKVDLQRRQALVASGSVSGDELTRAKNGFDAATAQLAAAKAAAAQVTANQRSAVAAKEANAALISHSSVDTNPEVAAARARLDQAKVDLARTVIRAPLDGVVAQRRVQLGQRVQPGMPLMAVVPVYEIYVDANFKEVQLEKVRVGQSVTLHADLYGQGVTYQGVVEGFSGGSGSAFSTIPAQNATGNWIKVVQRLPVRVKLDPAELQANPLKVGLSMSAEIDTRTGDKQATAAAEAQRTAAN